MESLKPTVILQKKEQLESVAKRLAYFRKVQSEAGNAVIWGPYMQCDNHMNFYEVYNHTVFGMYLVYRTLYKEVHYPNRIQPCN
jgi:hypothetical protein